MLHGLALGEAGVLIPVEAVASHGGGVAGVAVVDGEVQGHSAVAAILVATDEGVLHFLALGEADVLIPVEGVAGHGGSVAGVAVVDGEGEGDGAVAAGGIATKEGVLHGLALGEAGVLIPTEGVAGHGGGVAQGAVADGEVEGHHAVAAGGVGEREGGFLGGRLGVGHAVNPGVGVAVVLHVGAQGAVTDGEVECHHAVATGGVGEREGGFLGGRLGVGHAVNPGVGVAVVLHVGAAVAVAYGQHQGGGAVAAVGVDGIYRIVAADGVGASVPHVAVADVDALLAAVYVGLEEGRDGDVGRSLDGDGLGGLAVAPAHEVVAGAGGSGEGHRGEVVHRGGAADGAHGLVAGAGDGVLVVVEVGGDDAVTQGLHGGIGRGGDDVAVSIGPADEVVAVVGRGADGYGAEVVDRLSFADAAHHGVAADGGHSVLVVVKDGGEFHLAGGHHEGVAGSEDGVLAVDPGHEVVAVVGRGGDGHVVVGMVLAGAGHSAHGLIVVDGDLEVAGVDEVGRQGGVAQGGVLDGGGVDGDVAIAPASEAAALEDLGSEVQRAAVLHILEHIACGHSGVGGVIVGHSSTLGVVGEGDVVEVDGKGGREGHVLGGADGTRVVGVAVVPLHEVVARGSRGCEDHIGEVVHRGSAADSTLGLIGAEAGDSVLVVVEQGRDGGVLGGLDGDALGGGTVAPSGEVVAVVGRGGEGDVGQVVDRGGTLHSAHRGAGAEAGDGVLVIGEVGRQGGVADGRHIQRGGIALGGAVGVGPVDEVVAVVGRGHKGYALEVLDAAAFADATHGLVVDGGADGVHIGVEAGREAQVARLADGHGAWVVGVAVVPLGEVVAGLRRGADHDTGEVVHRAGGRSHSTHGGAGTADRDGVRIIGEVGRVGGILRDAHLARVGGVVVVPAHKVVARVGGGRDGDVGQVVLGGGATGATHHLVGAHHGDGVLVDGVGGRQGTVAEGGHGDDKLIAVERVSLIPPGEGIAVVGGGGEGDGGQVVHCLRARGAAHSGVGRGGGDGVLVVVKVGGDDAVAQGLHGHRSAGAEHSAGGIGPVHEVVAIVGCGGQRDVLQVVHGLRAAHAAHHFVTHTADGVLVVVEAGGIGGIGRNHNGARVVGVAVVPLGEVVAIVGRGGNLHLGQVVLRRGAADAAHGSVGRGHGDGVLVVVKVGGDDAVAQGLHGDALRGAEDIAVGGSPVHEVVAVVGGGGQRNVLQVVHRGGATDRTHNGVGRGSGYGIGVIAKVGVEGGVGHRREARKGRLAAEHVVLAVSPVDEVVAVVRRGHIVGAEEVLEGGGAFGGTHLAAHSVDGNLVHVGVEVGGEGAVAVGVDGEGLLSAGHGVGAVRPVDEVVAHGGRGGEGHGLVEVHRGGAAHSAPALALLLRHHGGSDGVLVAVVVDVDDGIAVQGEGLAVAGAEHRAVVVSPVGEVVAIDGLAARQGDTGVVVDACEAGGLTGVAAQRVVLSILGHVDGHGVLVALAHHDAVDGGGRVVADTAVVPPHEDYLVGAVGRHSDIGTLALPFGDIVQLAAAIGGEPAGRVIGAV